MKKIKTRQLEDSSWLAQTIKDMMDIEASEKGITTKWNCLNTLHIVVNEADKGNNDITYTTYNGNKGITISNISSLVSLGYGTDFDKYGMQCKLRGLAENYLDDNGNYIVSVLTTHDLNSAVIKDIDELMFQMQF